MSELYTYRRTASGPISGQRTNVLLQSQDYTTASWTKTGVTAARTNLLLQSGDTSNASWTKLNSTVSGAISGPDGSINTSFKIIENGTNAQHGVTQGITIVSGATTTVSAYVKAGERDNVRLQLGDSGTTNAFFVNVTGLSGSSPVASTGVVGAGTVASSVVTFVTNGWWRISVTGAVNGAVTAATVSLLLNAGQSYAGTTNWGTYANWFQAEAASSASAYIPTAAATASAAILIKSPYGTVTAQKIEETDGGTDHYITQSQTPVSGDTYILSGWFKAAERSFVRLQVDGGAGTGFSSTMYAVFNLASGTVGATAGAVAPTITRYDNGWYRCSIRTTQASSATATPISAYLANANSNATYSGTLSSGAYIWGLQFEIAQTIVDNSASEYMPSTTAAATGPGTRSRLVAWSAVGGTGGTSRVDLRNGGASGPILTSFDIPSGNTQSNQAYISENGVVFPDGIYCTITGTPTGVTIVYAG